MGGSARDGAAFGGQNHPLMAHFFTSDTHFGHAKILGYCNRPFSSIEEHDEALIANWNSTVAPQDVVFHLGDFCWGHPDKYLSRLNGHVRVIVGNHDKKNLLLKAGFEWVKDLYLGQVDNRPIFLFHYPCLSWPSRSRKSWHLFGHVHGRLTGQPLSLDVGVDCHGYQPISFEEVSRMIHNYDGIRPTFESDSLPVNLPSAEFDQRESSDTGGHSSG